MLGVGIVCAVTITLGQSLEFRSLAIRLYVPLLTRIEKRTAKRNDNNYNLNGAVQTVQTMSVEQ